MSRPSVGGEVEAEALLARGWSARAARARRSPSAVATPVDARPRMASPRSTCSILMTSAPQSARRADAAGTKVCSATSRTRTPCMTAVMARHHSSGPVTSPIGGGERRSQDGVLGSRAMELDGRAAIVTGGAGGLGAATVRRLVEQGVGVAVFDRDLERGSALADELGDARSWRWAATSPTTTPWAPPSTAAPGPRTAVAGRERRRRRRRRWPHGRARRHPPRQDAPSPPRWT